MQLSRIVRRYPIPEKAQRALVASLRMQASVVPLPAAEVVVVTSDPEDDSVLATARLGRVKYLVTGDHGLLRRDSYQGVRIISPRDFLALLRSGRS